MGQRARKREAVPPSPEVAAMSNGNDESQGVNIGPEDLAALPFLQARVPELEQALGVAQAKVGALVLAVEEKDRNLQQAQQIVNYLMEQFPENKREKVAAKVNEMFSLLPG